jgi:threonine dehydratase
MVHPVISPDDVLQAGGLIADRIRQTPVLEISACELLGGDAEGTVSLKLEYLQHSGTFKARGALHKLLVAERDLASDRSVDSDRSVVAASGGNHGVAVAWAAQQLGWRATIFVPTIAAPAKIERLASYGAEVHRVGAVFSEALAASEAFRAEHPSLSVHAYDDEVVAAGAGTVAVEWSEQTNSLDSIHVACGGGGLSAGIVSFVGPNLPVVVCETTTTSSFASALIAGRPVDVAVSGIAADALGATRLGSVAWNALTNAGSTSSVVTDDEVLAARHLMWEQFRIWLEPAAATAVAAFVAAPPLAGHHGILLCGANTSVQ